MEKYTCQTSCVRFTGRWVMEAERATATAVGSYFELAFTGRFLRLFFDVTDCIQPFPHLYLSVDGGARIESALSPVICVDAGTEGAHTVCVIYKSANEDHARWCAPLAGKVCFCGFAAEGVGTLAPDTRPVIEFVGDSITEGILTAADLPEVYPSYKDNMVYRDDTCATYAWQIAEALELRPVIMGYGAVGLTKGGAGGVPAVTAAYPFGFADAPVDTDPDIVVINHGANDIRAQVSVYLAEYEKLLDLIRAMHPRARLVVLSAFCGYAHTELGETVQAYNQKHGTEILFIDSNGWIPRQPLHPLRDGHTVIAEKVVPLLREFLTR